MDFIKARKCGPPRPNQGIDLIVIHTMEAPEKPGTARGVALWFAGSTSPDASAHYCVDAQETVLCVPEDVVAWAAPGANRQGIHIEHAGYAAQTDAQWADVYSLAMLDRSARLAAGIATRYMIPIQRLTVAELQLKVLRARGFCGHIDITNAYNAGKGHTDPGPHFPWEAYLALVRGYADPPPTLREGKVGA